MKEINRNIYEDVNDNFDKFGNLKSENACKVMLNLKRDCVEHERLYQVEIPHVNDGYLENYCDEYSVS